MGMFFQLLASGSKGNSILVCSAGTRILVDAGLSGKELTRRLDSTPVEAEKLDALVVSHEHQDHVRGLGPLSRRFDLPVYLSRGTLEGLPPQTGKLARTQIFQLGASFTIGDIKIQPFAIPHDAQEPSGFVFENDGVRLGICTDLGVATNLVRTRLQGCQGLILEANHDTAQLLSGPYPPHLKQRIRSRHGHLSNSDTCELLKGLLHTGLQSVVFAHLSEVNNTPELVENTFRQLQHDPAWGDVRFEIGKQSEATRTIQLF